MARALALRAAPTNFDSERSALERTPSSLAQGQFFADDPTFTEHGIYKEERVQRGLSPQPIKVVVSGTGSVPESARMFQRNGAPALVFTTKRIAADRLRILREVADAIHIVGEKEV